MRFCIERKILLNYLKSMIRVVPMGCKMLELEGFLFECNENDGFVYLTATNLETSIQRKIKANVETGGSFVLSANLLLNIVSLFGCEDVEFSKQREDIIIISSGNTRYTLAILNAKNYPKPEMPFPEHMIKVSSLCDLYSHTSSSVGTDKNRMALTGIHLDIYSDAVKAISCDASRMALLQRPSETGGKMSVTIPKQAFNLLVCAVNNEDVLEVGIDGKYVVFMKQDLLFSTRFIEDVFLDVNHLLKYHDKAFSAEVEVEELHKAIDSIRSVANLSNDLPILKMTFMENEIQFFYKGDSCEISQSISSRNVTPMTTGFFYHVRNFADCFRTIEGKAVMLVSSNGLLFISDENNQYMLTSTREVVKKENKTKKVA